MYVSSVQKCHYIGQYIALVLTESEKETSRRKKVMCEVGKVGKIFPNDMTWFET